MIYAEILSGGKGTRMGLTDMPKQFLKLGKVPILIHTVEKFLMVNKIDKVVVVVPVEWVAHTQDLIELYIPIVFHDRIDVCSGGSDRNESVMKGIKHIEDKYGVSEDDIVITHDAVRPFVSFKIIDDNIENVIKYGATDTVISAFDTVVNSNDGLFITEVPERQKMFLGQTPQSFKIQEFKSLYNSLTLEEKSILTDCAKIYNLKGKDVRLVEGDCSNIKITTTYDLKIANYILGDVNNNDK